MVPGLQGCKTRGPDFVCCWVGRKLRIHVPGAVYHVILRGNDRQAIFVDTSDRLALCGLLAQGTSRFQHSVHADVFMTNRLHLAVQVKDVRLSKVVHNFSFPLREILQSQAQS